MQTGRLKNTSRKRESQGRTSPPDSKTSVRFQKFTPFFIAAVAAVLLFWNLGDRYLWQDEAATAVLSARMLQFGRPLSYDGLNLITNDNFAAEDLNSIDQRTRDPKLAVDYYLKRGDFKSDTSWKYQPWGQFLITGVSLKLLGRTTLAARLPFAFAALLTVVCLYWFVWRYFRSGPVASIAALLLTLNSYWILHSRQCRYYALSSLFLVLTLVSYAAWQRSRQKWAAAPFIAIAWCWFQVDYGTVWPVLGVLFLDAFIANFRRNIWSVFFTGIVLAVTLAPFAYFYELWGRFSTQVSTWADRFSSNLFNMNEYVAPVVFIVAAGIMLFRGGENIDAMQRRLIAIGCGIFAAMAFWIPTVAPQSFVRYVVPMMPLAALIIAWVLVQAARLWKPVLAWLGVAAVLLTPIFCLVGYPFVTRPPWASPVSIMRPEISVLLSEVFKHRPDPNKAVVEWFRKNASPTDEILINYEDVPLMFYLPNPIRGGIPAFRAEDDVKGPPQFLVLRQTVSFVHWPIFQRVGERYHWIQIPIDAPDVPWGNNPDPIAQAQLRTEDYARASHLILARRSD